MHAYLNRIGLGRVDVITATIYIGNEAHKNHKLHTIIGPTPFGQQSVDTTRDDILNRGDRYNSTNDTSREVYAAWDVLALPVGVFAEIEELKQLGKAGAKTLAPDDNGYVAIHMNPHSGAADINWFTSPFHFGPFLRPRRNRRLHEEARLRNAINSEAETINESRTANGCPPIPLLRAPISNRMEAKVAGLAKRSGATITTRTLPGFLTAIGAQFTIKTDLIHFVKIDGRRTTFTTPTETFIREVERLLSSPKKAPSEHRPKEDASTLYNQWQRCAISPPDDRAMER